VKITELLDLAHLLRYVAVREYSGKRERSMRLQGLGQEEQGRPQGVELVSTGGAIFVPVFTH
jgi:hypothetical protein